MKLNLMKSGWLRICKVGLSLSLHGASDVKLGGEITGRWALSPGGRLTGQK